MSQAQCCPRKLPRTRTLGHRRAVVQVAGSVAELANFKAFCVCAEPQHRRARRQRERHRRCMQPDAVGGDGAACEARADASEAEAEVSPPGCGRERL